MVTLAQKLEESQSGASTKGIDDYNFEALDFIASCLHESWGIKKDDDVKFIASSVEAKMREISTADYCEDLDFVQFEKASGYCWVAYRNGTATAERMRRAAEELKLANREFEGSEPEEIELERKIRRMEGYQTRYEYWRMEYKASRECYRRIVAILKQSSMVWDNLPSEWQPPEARERVEERKKATASNWYIQMLLQGGENHRQFPGSMKQD